MTQRRYWSLFIREPGQQWEPQFGDYRREVVRQEMRDMKDSSSWVKGSKCKIVQTADDMNSITMAGNALNGIVIPDEQVLEERAPQ